MNEFFFSRRSRKKTKRRAEARRRIPYPGEANRIKTRKLGMLLRARGAWGKNHTTWGSLAQRDGGLGPREQSWVCMGTHNGLHPDQA